MTILLRDYQPSDADVVNTLVHLAFEQYRHAYTDWSAFSASFGRMVQSAHESEIIIAEVNGATAGAVAYVGPYQPKRSFYPSEWPVVRMLVVDPAWRGLGTGRALTQECIRRAERDRAPVIALHTSKLMNVALPMYERMGFTLERELPAIFGVSYGLYVRRLSALPTVPPDVPAAASCHQGRG
jgi:ribosomal protein S18 acetylase RimI-like enzyme